MRLWAVWAAGFLLMAVIASGCQPLVPAEEPPQFFITPMFFVSLDDRTYDTPSFRVRYPDGWEVVKSNMIWGAQEVYFISPDETMEIFVAALPPDPTETDAGLYLREATIELSDEHTVYVRGTAPRSAQEMFDRLLDQVIASLSLPESP